MDAEGRCLVVAPCTSCRNSKSGVKVCILRKHNARLTSVTRADLSSRHRQCVKPDQAMTIFKLVDRDTGQESVEFAPHMVFQTPCDRCQSLKPCILGGHTLQDWSSDMGSGDRSGQSKRKSLPSSNGLKSPQPPGPSPAPAQAPSPANESSSVNSGIVGGTSVFSSPSQVPSFKDMGGADEIATPDQGPPKRRPTMDKNVSNGRAASRPGGKAQGSDGIRAQLSAMNAKEEALMQEYQRQMREHDEAKAHKTAEIETAKLALEAIIQSRETTRTVAADSRKKLAVERQRLTDLLLREVVREEAKLRQERDTLWEACDGGPASAASHANASKSEGGSLQAGSVAATPSASDLSASASPRRAGTGRAPFLSGGAPSSQTPQDMEDSDADVDPGVEVDVGDNGDRRPESGGANEAIDGARSEFGGKSEAEAQAEAEVEAKAEAEAEAREARRAETSGETSASHSTNGTNEMSQVDDGKRSCSNGEENSEAFPSKKVKQSEGDEAFGDEILPSPDAVTQESEKDVVDTADVPTYGDVEGVEQTTDVSSEERGDTAPTFVGGLEGVGSDARSNGSGSSAGAHDTDVLHDGQEIARSNVDEAERKQSRPNYGEDSD